MTHRKLLPALLLFSLSTLSLAASIEIHVSPAGDDANPGTASLPLRTLDAALAAARSAHHPATILIAGTHYLPHTLSLDSRDSNTTLRGDAPDARLLLAQPLPPLTPVTAPAVLSRLPKTARPHVLQSDLKPLHLPSYGTLHPRGFGRSYPGALELFFGDQPLTLARYPNQGSWAHISPTNGDTTDHFSYAPPPDHPIPNHPDIWLHGYWTWDWADSYEHLASYDPATHTLHTSPPHGVYGYRANQPFYLLNLLEELDSPGEYYLDRQTGILYVYPPIPPSRHPDLPPLRHSERNEESQPPDHQSPSFAQGREPDSASPGGLRSNPTIPQPPTPTPQFWISTSPGPILSIANAHDVTISSLTLEGSWTTAVEIKDCTNTTLSHCTLRNTATDGVTITGGSSCGLSHCTLYNTGESPVRLSGGSRKSLTPAHHFVDDCDIHHYARTCRTYRPAVELTGVGSRVSHCSIHDAPHQAVLLHGNDHLIEDSIFYNLCTETGDAGAIYLGRDWTERGTVIRHNLFHHIQGPGHLGTSAVYFDDGTSAGTIQDNIFYRCYRALLLGGSTDMTVDHNLFVDCDTAVYLDGRCDMLDSPTWKDNYDTLTQRLKSVDYHDPPWSTRYPTLLLTASLATHGQGVPPARDTFRHNLHSGGQWLALTGVKNPSLLSFDHNALNTPATLFTDPPHLDFHLKTDTPPLKEPFPPIPQRDLGPRPQ